LVRRARPSGVTSRECRPPARMNPHGRMRAGTNIVFRPLVLDRVAAAMSCTIRTRVLGSQVDRGCRAAACSHARRNGRAGMTLVTGATRPRCVRDVSLLLCARAKQSQWSSSRAKQSRSRDCSRSQANEPLRVQRADSAVIAQEGSPYLITVFGLTCTCAGELSPRNGATQRERVHAKAGGRAHNVRITRRVRAGWTRPQKSVSE
jgi:hypothetical protein